MAQMGCCTAARLLKFVMQYQYIAPVMSAACALSRILRTARRRCQRRSSFTRGRWELTKERQPGRSVSMGENEGRGGGRTESLRTGGSLYLSRKYMNAWRVVIP